MKLPAMLTPIVALLVGTERRMVARRALCLLAGFVYSCWNVLLLFYALPKGLVSPSVAYFFLAYNCVALLTFYPLVRSHLTARWPDPGLVAPQILWASGAMVMAYVTAPVVRPGTFQTLCLIQVFGFLTLRPHQAVRVGLAVIAMLMLAWLAIFCLPNEHADPRAEAIKITAACFDLVVLTLQSRRFARLRERTYREKVALGEAAAELRRITFHDALTGLCNRAYMEERLKAEIQRLSAGGPGFSLALIDLDHFKRINDTHGHQTGDAALIAFAQVASQVVRDTDVVGRWGGEEFLILMPDTVPGDNAWVAIRRLHQRLAESPSVCGEGVPQITFSCGIANWTPGRSLAQLQELADQALYQAKHSGRNQTVVAA
jgi:diguanylate cyclase (GGDEF)-like protein